MNGRRSASADRIAQIPLTIHAANGVHPFTVEVAATQEQQERGLMFCRSLAPDAG